VSTIRELVLTDFRCYHSIDVSFVPGVTLISGANGQGKTSLLEAIGWAASARSFRGVPDAALVRTGCESAVLRTIVDTDGREQLLEAEIQASGRNRVRLNRQPLKRTRDLLGLVRVTVFSPDDLDLVKGGPSERRRYLDDLLVAITPRYEAARSDFEKVLKHRNALLRQRARGPDAESTLEVFDHQFAQAGGELVRGRLRMVEHLIPEVRQAYDSFADGHGHVDAVYEAEWAEGQPPLDGIEELLGAALRANRAAELERGVTLTGPHRDEWRLRLNGLDARHHGSQGEQRTLALSLRLAGHRLCAEITGTQPVLLLDDVFSELDPQRARALIEHLPVAQALVTTASSAPPGMQAERRLRVRDGLVEEDE
jgi:DNA replication and repair protein RecF